MLAHDAGADRAVLAFVELKWKVHSYKISSTLRNKYAGYLPKMYLLTARLCASSVSENSLLPSPRATK
jgi:hypothetical protein